MGTHIEVPLRIPQQPWPGLGTRIGFLDPQVGFLEDGSINMMINRADTLQKRKGFIRGLEKAFTGPVCGLFKYTDKCGIEYLLVADQVGINIEQPFAVPLFENSDAYPFDSFENDGFPSTYNWRNIDRYIQANDELRMRAGTAASADPQAPTELMRWFKEATNQAYQLRIQYDFDETSDVQQQFTLSIKGSGDLSSGAFLLANMRYSNAGTYNFTLCHHDGASLTVLANSVIAGSAVNVTGFFTLAYTRDIPGGVFTAIATVLPNGGNEVSISGTVTALDDATFAGNISAIGVGYAGGVQPDHGIMVVDGGPL